MQQLPLGVRLRERANFDSFFIGSNHALVRELQGLAHYRRRGCHWLFGAAAAGKTHLLQAVFAAAAEQGAAAFLPLRELQALGAESLSGWQSARCLCVDDVDCVLGDRQWELALFALYREAEEHGTALIVTAASAPGQCVFALPDLASRFRAASIHALIALDEVQQREALRLHARQRGLELPDDSLLFLQRHQPRDMASLCQLLDRLDSEALSAQRRLTIPFIREVLERLVV
jgi:DnaA-homolog protein